MTRTLHDRLRRGNRGTCTRARGPSLRGRPEFILLGGRCPLLCAGSSWRHAGTTKVDVRSTSKSPVAQYKPPVFEQASGNAECEPDVQRAWRWNFTDPSGVRTVVKFELVADLETAAVGRFHRIRWV